MKGRMKEMDWSGKKYQKYERKNEGGGLVGKKRILQEENEIIKIMKMNEITRIKWNYKKRV